jgi:hypothetical protein
MKTIPKPPSYSGKWAIRLFLLLLCCTLDFCRTPESLLAVLALLACCLILSVKCHPSPDPSYVSEKRTLLSRWLLHFGSNTNSDQSVVRFELLQGLRRIIDESETSCLSTTELRT